MFELKISKMEKMRMTSEELARINEVLDAGIAFGKISAELKKEV